MKFIFNLRQYYEGTKNEFWQAYVNTNVFAPDILSYILYTAQGDTKSEAIEKLTELLKQKKQEYEDTHVEVEI